MDNCNYCNDTKEDHQYHFPVCCQKCKEAEKQELSGLVNQLTVVNDGWGICLLHPFRT